MEDELCFVQFIHPGGEHEPDDGTLKRWNRGKHRRKFLRRMGKYIEGPGLKTGEIVFWGEWEAESRTVEIPDPEPDGPRFIHEPFYLVPNSYHHLQNTDPWVYGERFHYTACLQYKGGHATQLNRLKPGSLILFGSCAGKSEFVLDTAFVVDHGLDHNLANYRMVLKGAISQEYEEVTIAPLYGSNCADGPACGSTNRHENWRLYFGARHDRPLNGIYSFFPCLPYDQKQKGFIRPRIHLSEITDNLNQSMKLTRSVSMDRVTGLWEEVVDQVKKQGLVLGVYADIPERRKG